MFLYLVTKVVSQDTTINMQTQEEYRDPEMLRVVQTRMLWEYLNKSGLSKEELATKFGVTTQDLNRWLDGEIAFLNEEIKLIEKHTWMIFPTLAERSTNWREVIKYHLKHWYYIWNTSKQRHLYAIGKVEGCLCTGHNNGVMNRRYFYDRSKPPKKNFVDKESYKILFYPLKNKNI